METKRHSKARSLSFEMFDMVVVYVLTLLLIICFTI